MMKCINKIAPFLIVLYLGISFTPQVYSLSGCIDTNKYQKPPQKNKTFSGVIIDPVGADQLLYQTASKKPAAYGLQTKLDRADHEVLLNSTQYNQPVVNESNSFNIRKKNVKQDCLKNESKLKYFAR